MIDRVELRDTLERIQAQAIEACAHECEVQGDKWANAAGCEDRAVAARILAGYIRARVEPEINA